MFGTVKYSLLCKTVLLLFIKSCACEPQTPYLALYALGDAEYADVVVRRERDNVTLVCEVRGDATPRVFVWNYVGAGSAGGNETGDGDSGIPQSLPLPSGSGAAQRSTLERRALRVADSGHYMCSSPPFSVTKYLLVQTKGPPHCARGAFWCGVRCVLPGFVCDGRADCLRAEDEAPGLCGVQPCARSDRLNCSSGRCIPEAACCRPPGAVSLCAQHDCCGEHPRYSTLQAGYVEVEYPPLFEDRHSPDDYGFIQSTIYTVTACALIFMVAVVLLVSALCKMHMKRAALRGYRATASHYESRFPPRYEATRLLDSGVPPSPIRSPQGVCPGSPGAEPPTGMEPPPAGLARLSAIFCSRYRQVPTQCCDVEMTDVRSASLNSSPSRPRPHMAEYRSPALTDLYYTDPDLTACGRDLNYMATPIDLFRRSYRRNTLDQRPLTLQLGRFQLSIPRFGRRSEDPRPDTPNVAEINIDDLDFVRLNSNETYTLNGRTIRLLGANFENYPVVDGSRPPPYNEAMRFKTYGPPPEYLSREAINTPNTDCNENEARTNVEMPPCYEDLASGVDTNANIENLAVNVIDLTDTGTGNVNNNVIDNDNDLFVETTIVSNDNGNCNVNDNDTVQIPESISSVIDNLPAIDSDVNANDAYNDTGVTVND